MLRLGKEAAELADYCSLKLLCVCIGERAPYTGLKPAGLDWSPVVPKVEKAIENEDAKEVIDSLSNTVEEELQIRSRNAIAKKNLMKMT